MARVICELPNASAEIGGVKFTEDRGQMISEEIDDAAAERFARIPGFKLIKGKGKGKTAEEKAAAEAEAQAAAESAAEAKTAEEKAAAAKGKK